MQFVCSSHTISGVLPGGPLASRHGFEERVRAAAAAGFTGMCLHLRDYSAQRRAGRSDAELREVLRQAGMRHNSVEFLSNWFEPSGEADIALALAAASAYGATHINVGADLANGNRPVAELAPAFAALCRRAGAAGVGIALEIVAWSNVRDIDGALELLAHGGDNDGLVIDAWHVFRGGIALDELRRLDPARIACVQISDAAASLVGTLDCDTIHRRFCGEGVFDLRGFLDTLWEMGVTAPLSVEIISPEAAGMEVNEVARRAHDSAMRVVESSRFHNREQQVEQFR